MKKNTNKISHYKIDSSERKQFDLNKNRPFTSSSSCSSKDPHAWLGTTLRSFEIEALLSQNQNQKKSSS